jgi:hypothetical protein
MRYVIIRDDDTNALTPVECLERLYRPFLDRGMPVNLAVIPDVTTDARLPDGSTEGFLMARTEIKTPTAPIAGNETLVRYLRDNSGYKVVQHGCHHHSFEFDLPTRDEIARRLEQGTQCLLAAGFPKPDTFVAPHDRFSRPAYAEVASRFPVVSSGWFELSRLPHPWWPQYLVKKARKHQHWRVGGTLLLSHPGCLLSYRRNYDLMLDSIEASIESRQLTVLVTHWWEYFRNQQEDTRFIELLHETAECLARRDDVKVISFSEAMEKDLPLN